MDVFKRPRPQGHLRLEPYANDRGARFADDVFYLLREYGERRRFDAFLVLRNEDGRSGPVFKGFRTILPDQETDCRGRVSAVDDFTPDSVWWAQNDRIRQTLRGDFDHVTLLADSLALRAHARGGLRRHRDLRQLPRARALSRHRARRVRRAASSSRST